MSRAFWRTPSLNAPGNTSLPHQPPLYGVNSLAPTTSVNSGPTSVPDCVAHASSVAPRQLIRFMILTSGSLTISSLCLLNSSSFEMKNVVWPESPNADCTTRSRPSLLRSAICIRCSKLSTFSSAFGTENTPALLPMRTVSILLSQRWRSLAGGNQMSRPISLASDSVFSSNIRKVPTGLPPRRSIRSTTSLCCSR